MAGGALRVSETDDLVAALSPVADAFRGLGISFYVGGSIASTFHGAIRSTMDVDLVCDLPPELVDGFLKDRPRLTRVLAFLTHPVTGGVLFTLCFSMWHFPELYEAALRSRPLHVLEHWSMFLPAILMVWPLFSLSSRLPRIGYGMAIFYSFGLMIADLPLWAVLIFGDHPIYETYRLAPRVSELSAAADMILGAVVMKGFNEIFALLCMGYAFFAWYQEEK